MSGPYPLATLAVTISATGISAPSFYDIQQSLFASYLAIYGIDVSQDPSTQDYQWITVQAQAINDVNNAVIAAYNNMSPATAVGAGLSSNVKINGLQREVFGFSNAPVTIIGQAGTIITSGIATDGVYQWALPANVVIPSGGSINQTVTCLTPGAIASASGAINQIVNPQLGWQSITNTAAATLGAPVETDAALRLRQEQSTELPALSITGGLYGALKNLPGVTQVKIYENDTKVTDGDGVPANSICVVIEGGNAVTIAQTIQLYKGQGCGTYGSTSETAYDQAGIPITINFDAPTQDTILVNLTLTPLAGYVSTTGTNVINALVNAINGLGIGANSGLLSLSWLASVVNTVPLSNTLSAKTISYC